MADLARYQAIIQDLLTGYATTKPANGEIDVEVSFDTERHHYQIWHTGWLNKRWIHQAPIHCAIREGKVWLLANATEHDVAADMVAQGIPKGDIVLGFHPREMRAYSDYAVG